LKIDNLQAVILAGGKGTRLKSLTENKPKPMVRLDEKPFMEILLRMLNRKGFKKFVLLVGYLSNVIIDYFGDGSKFGLDIKYSIEHEPLGTAGGLKNAEKQLENEFLLINGDTLIDINYDKFIEFSKMRNKICTMLCYNGPLFDEVRNNLMIDQKDLVTKYSKSQKNPKFNATDAGIYFMKKTILSMIKTRKSSLENEIFNVLISNQQLCAFPTQIKFYDIGTIRKLDNFRNYYNSSKKNITE